MKRMVLAFALIAAAQAQKPAFEVASVKLNNSNTTGGYVRPAGERLTVSNISLKGLILYAYRAANDTQLLSSQVAGGPDWTEKDRFDIEAKAETTGKAVSQDQMRLMVQSLLEDRVKLKVHRETRELPVYNMVLEKNGPKMKLSGDQTPAEPRGVALMTGEQTPSGTMLVFFGNAVSLSKIAATLQGMVQRPLIDKTNMKGLFDFRIRFSPSLMPAFPEQTRPEDGQLNAPSDHPLLPIIQDELGLKLQPGKGPVEVLVIDSAQKPSEN